MSENGQPGSTLASRLRRGSPSFTYGQATLSTTASMLADFVRTRAGLLVVNLSAIDVWIGDQGVTSSNGVLLLGVKGSAISISTTAPIWAVASSGTPTVSWMDLHD